MSKRKSSPKRRSPTPGILTLSKHSKLLSSALTGSSAAPSFELLAKAFAHSFDHMLITDPDGTIIYANPAVSRITGYSHAEVIGSTPRLWKSPNTPQSYHQLLWRTIKLQKKPFNGFIQNRRKNGQLYDAQVSVSPVLDSRGQVRGFLGIERDITLQKQAEAELERREEAYKQIFEKAPMPIVVQKNGKTVYANSKVEDLTGHSLRSLMGRPVYAHLDLQSSKAVRQALWQTLRGKFLDEMTVTLIRKNGERRLLKVKNAPITYEGGPATISIIDDITEKQKMESELVESREAFRQVIDQAPMPIGVQENGKAVYVNAKLAELTGYSKDELTGHSVTMPLDAPSRRLVQAALLAARIGIYPPDMALTIVRKNGERRSIIVRSAHTQYMGKSAGIHIMEDVTEINKAQKTVKEYTQKLEDEVHARTKGLEAERDRVAELSRVKDEFIRNITHELKTPLTIILGSISLLRKMTDVRRHPERGELIDLLERNGKRLAESIDQVLNLTRLESAELYKEKFDLRPTADEVCEEYWPLANAKGITLSVQGASTTLSADRHLLRLALSNLVSNAIKFTNNGGVRIAIAKKGRQAILSVRDTGIGITPENQKKIFIKFFKADPTAPGTGIGLNAVEEIVKKHGGKILFNSIKGKGSTFEIILAAE